jgi:hypothetical protein
MELDRAESSLIDGDCTDCFRRGVAHLISAVPSTLSRLKRVIPRQEVVVGIEICPHGPRVGDR